MDIGSVQQGTAGDYDDVRVGRLRDFADRRGAVGSAGADTRAPVTGRAACRPSRRSFRWIRWRDRKFTAACSIEYKITTASSYGCLMVPSSAIVNTDSGTAVFAKPLTDENGNEIPFEETPCRFPRVPKVFRRIISETGRDRHCRFDQHGNPRRSGGRHRGIPRRTERSVRRYVG